MPEGDTLFRTAVTLRRALAGREVTGFRSPLSAFIDVELIGRTVTDVEARGKNLLIHFDDGRALYSHLRMTGSWHIYRPGEPWQKPERRARAVIETEAYVAICFNAPVVELLTENGVRRHHNLERLGPDLLKDPFDYNDALQRLRGRDLSPIGEAVMRQDTIAGIGNIWKSEMLFICRMDPFALVHDYKDRDLKILMEKAREYMKRNLDGNARTTRYALDGGKHWVYNRSGMPCLKCGTTIRMRRQGYDGRSTYWCTECQSKDEG